MSSRHTSAALGTGRKLKRVQNVCVPLLQGLITSVCDFSVLSVDCVCSIEHISSAQNFVGLFDVANDMHVMVALRRVDDGVCRVVYPLTNGIL